MESGHRSTKQSNRSPRPEFFLGAVGLADLIAGRWPQTIGATHMLRGYPSNIYYLYLIKLAKWLMLIMPVVALFYQDNGLDDLDLFLLQAVYSITIAVTEIPSGYMADILGRKKALVLGSILGTVGYLIYSTSHGLYGFLAAEVILGVGGSLISGADSALLFDSLATTRDQHKYLQYEGRITSLGNFAETAAAICGGLLAAGLGYRAVYIAQTLVAALAIPASLLLLEPPREAPSLRPGLRHVVTICQLSLFTDRRLSSAMLLSAVAGVATLCMAWSAQAYLVTNGFGELAITPLWVTLNLTVAASAAFATSVQQFLGRRLALFLIIVYLPLAYILLGLLPIIPAIISLYLFYLVRGYATPMLKDLINQHCPSASRATVLSIRSLLIRLGFALLGPAIGLASDLSSLALALVGAGSVLLLAALLVTIRLLRFMPDACH